MTTARSVSNTPPMGLRAAFCSLGMAAAAWTSPALAQYSPAPDTTGKTTGSCAKLAYPQADVRDENQGTVTLNFLVGEDGTVKDTRILHSSGSRSLDEAARIGLAKCRFKPVMQDGHAVESWVRVQYVWALT